MVTVSACINPIFWVTHLLMWLKTFFNVRGPPLLELGNVRNIHNAHITDITVYLRNDT